MSYRLNVRKNGRNKQYLQYQLTVPVEIAQLVPEGTEFTVDADDGGIHYRPVEPTVLVNAPSWGLSEEEQ